MNSNKMIRRVALACTVSSIAVAHVASAQAAPGIPQSTASSAAATVNTTASAPGEAAPVADPPQTSAPVTNTAPPQTSAPAEPAPIDGSAGGDIVVTAQRRAERLQEVPISITVLNDRQLRASGVASTIDLPKITPGLRVDRTGVFTQPSLRGINTSLVAVGSDNPVAIYVDGVYIQSQYGATFDLPDVDRIEVLKGPQGTLFGRNATGGAIRVETKGPQDTLGGDLFASYGSFNDVQLKGFVTAPLADGVAFSLAGSYQHNDGYLHDIANGGKRGGGLESYLIRGKLRFDLTSKLQVQLSGMYSKRSDRNTVVHALNGNAIVARPALGLNPILPTGYFDYAADLDPLTEVESYLTNAKVTWQTGAGTFTSLSAFNRWIVNSHFDGDFAALPTKNGTQFNSVNHEQGFSQEVNFASRKFGPLSFVSGVYYFDGYGETDPSNSSSDYPPVYNLNGWARQNIKTIAAYTEATIQFTKQLSLIGGLRYSDEKRSLAGDRLLGTAPKPATLTFRDSRADSSWTPRVSLKFQPNHDLNFYATYSKGFKSGTFNTSVPTPPIQSTKPETLDAYEIGAKGQAGPLSFTAAAFYYDYRNKQETALVRIVDGNGNVSNASQIQNAARAHIKGIELGANLRLSSALTANASLAVLDAKYVSFRNATLNVPDPANNGRGNITVTRDVTGNHLVRAPDLTFTLSATYQTNIAGGEFSLTPSIYYSSKYYFEPGNRITQPSYTMVDLRASFEPANSNLTLSVYGRNLTDVKVLQSAFIGSVGDGVSYNPPATYGISAAFKF